MTLQNHKKIAGGHEYIGISEIIPDRFYFATFKKNTPHDTEGVHYFTMGDDTTEPFNLATIARFLKKVNMKLSYPDLACKAIVYGTSGSVRKRCNAAILVGVYAIVYLQMNPEEISEKLTQHSSISPVDCLNSVNNAIQLGFINFEDFNEDDFDNLDKIKLNWIVPGKLLKFSGPAGADQANYLSPKHYLRYFRASGVSTIVRVGHMKYDANPFVNNLSHYDLTVSGTVPSDTIVRCFMDICEISDGAIAVQSREELALGRTNCLFAAYLVKHYHLKATEAVAWLRLCSSESISGIQLEWLKNSEAFLWNLGNEFRMKNIDQVPSHFYGIYSYRGLETSVHDLKKRIAEVHNPSEEIIYSESFSESAANILRQKPGYKEEKEELL